MINNLDLGWAVGFFEGEGCFAVDCRNAPRVEVSNSDLSCLEKFQEIVGCGKIYVGNGQKRKAHHKQMYRWVAQSLETSQYIAELFFPHLSERRQEAAQKILDLKPKYKKGFCHRNHALIGDNLLVYPNGKRYCRTCQRLNDKVQWQRKKSLNQPLPLE